VARKGATWKSFVLGSSLGGVLGFPVGLAQDAIVRSLPEEQRRDRDQKIAQMLTIAEGNGESIKPFNQYMANKSSDPVGDVIARLEGRFDSAGSPHTTSARSTEDKDQVPSSQPWWAIWRPKLDKPPS